MTFEELEEDEGYDSEIFEDPQKAAEFKCSICTCITKDPVETNPCGHLYCKICLEKYFQSQSSSLSEINSESPTSSAVVKPECPSCRSKIQHTTQSPWVKRMVLALRIKCTKFEEGCAWKSELRYFNDHIRKQCMFVSVHCKYCAVQLLRGKLKNHSEICDVFPLTCDLCKNANIHRKDFKLHCTKTCPLIEIACPNECGAHIEQSRMDEHVRVKCVHRTVQCLYCKYGCSHPIKYSEFRLHLSQYQVMHLELKVLFLERLTQSTELMYISNTTGLYPGISGIYYRHSEPHNCRPVYQHKIKENHYMYYSHQVGGWVIDVKGFDGKKYPALRIGKYPTPNAKFVDSDGVLFLENMLLQECAGKETKGVMSLSGKHNDDADEHEHEHEHENENENKSAETEIEMEMDENNNNNNNNSNVIQNMNNMNIEVEPHPPPPPPQPQRNIAHVVDEKLDVLMDSNDPNHNNNNSNSDQQTGADVVVVDASDVSQIVCQNVSDGRWHVNGKLRQSHIQVKGCTAVEFELEWELKTLKSAIKKLQLYTTGNIVNIQKQYAITCICGKGLEKTSASNANYANNTAVFCNICESNIPSAMAFYHCPSGHNMTHLQGFDLCLSCAEARGATQNLSIPKCICKHPMVAVMGANAYPGSGRVSCNECREIVASAVWHCPKKKTKKHGNGYDYCLACGKKQTGSGFWKKFTG